MRNELYHHGIKGQRWGVRNGPPYPLNAQTHAAVVRGSGGRIGSAERVEEERRAKKKRIIRNLAIGAGAAAALGAGAYAFSKTPKGSKIREDLIYKMGDLPGSAKLLDARNSVRNLGRLGRNAARSVKWNANAAGVNAGNKLRNAIAGKSQQNLEKASRQFATARRNRSELNDFIKKNYKSFEKSQIETRKHLANMKRNANNAEMVKELNKKAVQSAAQARASKAKGARARELMKTARSQYTEAASRLNSAQSAFDKRHKIAKIAAKATNVGLGTAGLGAAGTTVYAVRKHKKKRRR